MTTAGIAIEVAAEANRAHRRYGPPVSAAESYGVLMEEVAELLDAIRERNLDQIRHEAIQCSAVAVRLAEWVDNQDRTGVVRL